MKLDRRTDRLGRGEVVVDQRIEWPITWFTRYLWRGPVTGKLYSVDICDAHNAAFLRECGRT